MTAMANKRVDFIKGQCTLCKLLNLQRLNLFKNSILRSKVDIGQIILQKIES